jgi:AcrR family transcriptional regulator
MTTQEPSAPGKRATLARILAAARDEFAANGLAGARVDAIAAAAGVTKQLVYHYFEGKEKLFAAVLAEASAAVMAELVGLDVAHLPPSEAMRAFLNHIFDQYDADPQLRSLSQEGSRYHESHPVPGDKFEAMAPALVAVLQAILSRGEAAGQFRAGVDARVFAAMAALVTSGGFTNRFMLSVLAGFDTTSADGAAAWRRYSADFVLAAIAAPGSATK